jgi:hypothetical protein
VHRHEVGSPQPQGSSLLPELCCLEPSSLNRPHPPHSWAHRIFTAWRLIRDAFAVRERLGDPRVVPGFRYPFCPGIPSSPTPGSSIIVSSSAAMSTRPSPRVDRLGTPKTPAIRFTRAMTFVASWFTHLLRSASLLAPCTDLTGYPASGAFTSGLSAGWSPFPLQDITTTATGLLCWRDSHPLEWQLASLHLLLHRDGLAPSTPCRSPGALRFAPINGHRQAVSACPFRATRRHRHSYSITSSARSRNASGIVRPSALVALRLITNSNFVGCSNGRSAGLAPFKILST